MWGPSITSVSAIWPPGSGAKSCLYNSSFGHLLNMLELTFEEATAAVEFLGGVFR